MQQGFPATEGGGEREEMGRELGGSGGGHGEVGGDRERGGEGGGVRGVGGKWGRERQGLCMATRIRQSLLVGSHFIP